MTRVAEGTPILELERAEPASAEDVIPPISLRLMQGEFALIDATDTDRAELLADIAEGLYVTDLIGMGANMVTGDYSRGVSGFWIEHGEVLTFGDASVSLIHLRGHTPGSLAVLYDAGGRLADSPHVFTGDSLFPGGVGKTDSPEAFTSLFNDVSERLFGRLPDATWVYPGHGHDTTLGAERPHLGEWRERGW